LAKEDTLGGTVKAYINDFLGIIKCLSDKILKEYFIGCTGINLPDNIVPYIKGVNEPVKTFYSR